MFIHADGTVTGSVHWAGLVAAHAAATDEAARANLAAFAAAHGVTLGAVAPDEWGDQIRDDLEPGDSGRPAQADNKAAWVDYAVSQGLERGDAEEFTKAELIDLYTDKD